jgi:hypothetical protein
MRKRARDDEQLPSLHIADVQLGPHIGSASNIVGTSSTVSTSNVAGMRDIAGASNIVGAFTLPVAVALQGASTTLGARASTCANFNPGTIGSASTIQPLATMYLLTPRNNLRMLEIWSNMEAFGTLPVPSASQTSLCGRNTITLWRRRYKQQEDRIQALTCDMNALLKETANKIVIIANHKAELERLRVLVKEPTATNDALLLLLNRKT